MWYQFFLQNAHFALNVLAALVMAATAWLYFDAWRASKMAKDSLKAGGFLLLAASFLLHAITVEASLLLTNITTSTSQVWALVVSRIVGYLLVSIGLAIEPIQKRPETQPQTTPAQQAILVSSWSSVALVQPVLAGLCGLLYLRRATVGMERHLRPAAIAFLLLTFFEIASLRVSLAPTTSVDLFNLLAAFGPVWMIEHLLLFIAIILIGRWVFVYLLKRLLSQLVIIFTATVVLLSILISIAFTSVLVRNIQEESLKQLETNARVLEFAFNSKLSETLTDAELVAQNEVVQITTKEGLRTELNNSLEKILLTKNLNMLVVTDNDGRVIGRGENRERLGEALKEDPLIKRALAGETVSTAVSKDSVLAPKLSVRASVPIKEGEQIIGTVTAGILIDNAFVDSVKTATQLDVSVYGGNQLSATTFVSRDGVNRPIGIREENKQVTSAVLVKGTSYLGAVNFLNQPYFAAYLPILDLDKAAVGMLVVAKPQITVLQTAARAIETTFIITAIILVLSLLPIYLVSRSLTNQLK